MWVPLLNLERSPGIQLLNIAGGGGGGGSWVPLLKLKGVPGPTFKLSGEYRVSGSWFHFYSMPFWHRCFPVNFEKFSRTPFLQSTSGQLLLKFSCKNLFTVWSYDLGIFYASHKGSSKSQCNSNAQCNNIVQYKEGKKCQWSKVKSSTM